MDICKVTVESSVDQLEPLCILEEGDEPLRVTNSRDRGRTVLRVRAMEDNTRDASSGVTKAPEGSSLDHNLVPERSGEGEAKEEKNSGLEDENFTIKENGLSDGIADIVFSRQEKKPNDQKVMATEVTLRPRDRLSPDDAHPMLHRLSSDFPDALCELLFTLQEGRRLNDQRCSFHMERRRRCYSEPSTPRHTHRGPLIEFCYELVSDEACYPVLFSSMTSLQKEEFFDLLASSQGRRLDDQRAELQNVPSAPSKPKQRKSSIWRFTEVNRGTAQGRLEEQRSAAPGPMDDEDFFSLLLKVQGGRMDEQRMELKPLY
ncbi:hypothetical protein DNTS_004883 [Danionella cerebrum]|uniref:Uncharacterized protein n=1 Tax=Danionella cerebrum TaxID=2873325 RepID=A0A553MQK1_9TELE|nr:hypothetical protein DNTS_004883 [Danionella translucida]